MRTMGHDPNRAYLIQRANMISAIRSYFEDRQYLEVETPIRIPAPAPEAHIEAEPSGTWFLQTSPELCLKRLLAAGFERVFQICKCFRRGERGRLHLPEMTMLEWYTAEHDYQDMMRQCEELIIHVARSSGYGDIILYQDTSIDLTRPWARVSVHRVFEKYGSISVEEAFQAGSFDEMIACEIAPNLGFEKPVFLFDYPVELGSLARRKSDDPSLAERFELYIAGIEICNAFSELNDPVEQRKRFEAEIALRESFGKISYPLPERFLAELGKLPECTGNALGIDRLVMLLTDAAEIDDVVAFTPENL